MTPRTTNREGGKISKRKSKGNGTYRVETESLLTALYNGRVLIRHTLVIQLLSVVVCYVVPIEESRDEDIL